jgi:MFS family permease
MSELFSEKFNAIGIGNILEYYDFSIFGCFLDVIGPQFFPDDSPKWQLIQTSAIFGAAFVMRPIGGILFGYMGDIYDREKALEISIVLMILPTLMMAFLPGEKIIGVWAAILLILLRMCQGIASGGEMPGAFCNVFETCEQARSGYWGGACKATAVLGNSLGIGMAALIRNMFTEEQVESFGWRIAFLFGTILGVIGYRLRMTINDKKRGIYYNTLHASITTANQKVDSSNPISLTSVSESGDQSPISPVAIAKEINDTMVILPSAPNVQDSNLHQTTSRSYQGIASSTQVIPEEDVESAKGSEKYPLLAVCWFFCPEVLTNFFFIGFWCVTYYTIFVWNAYFLTTPFLTHADGEEGLLDTKTAWIIVFASNIALVLLLPVGGYFGDALHAYLKKTNRNHYSRDDPLELRSNINGHRIVMLIATLCMFFSIQSLYANMLDNSSVETIIESTFGLVVAVGIFGGNMPHVICSFFNKSVRYTGVALSYNLANALVSATAPVVQTYLVMQGSNYNEDKYNDRIVGWKMRLEAWWYRIVNDTDLHPALYIQLICLITCLSLTCGVNVCQVRAIERKKLNLMNIRNAHSVALSPTLPTSTSSSSSSVQESNASSSKDDRHTVLVKQVYIHVDGN